MHSYTHYMSETEPLAMKSMRRHAPQRLKKRLHVDLVALGQLHGPRVEQEGDDGECHQRG